MKYYTYTDILKMNLCKYIDKNICLARQSVNTTHYRIICFQRSYTKKINCGNGNVAPEHTNI